LLDLPLTHLFAPGDFSKNATAAWVSGPASGGFHCQLGELANWRTGELANWGSGDLAKGRAGQFPPWATGMMDLARS
jgi:hypothetical protein